MKKVIVPALCLALFYAACSSPGDKSKTSAADSGRTVTGGVTSDNKGLEMIGTLDCTTCHAINEKKIGPAYMDVSKKYDATEENVNNLAHKVISGGAGVWGTVPMTPHAISIDSAKEMVRYILTLKNQQ